jgi:CPSF A subunit region
VYLQNPPTPPFSGLLTVGIDCVRMEGNNLPQAVAACALVNVSTDEKKSYFVVGTAVEASELDEPKEGYVQVYEVGEVGGRLRVDRVVEIKVPGSVFCVDECDGKLVCGIGSTVRSPPFSLVVLWGLTVGPGIRPDPRQSL